MLESTLHALLQTNSHSHQLKMSTEWKENISLDEIIRLVFYIHLNFCKWQPVAVVTSKIPLASEKICLVLFIKGKH